MTDFNPMTITLIVCSHWDETVTKEEVSHNDSLFTTITVKYPFARWDYVQTHVAGVTSTVYDFRTGREEGARNWLQFLGDQVKTARYPRKLQIFVRLKNEDHRPDSDAPGGPSARGHAGHEGEDGPATDPESWWFGGPGPVSGVGPAEQHDEDAAFARMRAILEAEDRQLDSEEDYASAKEDQSSSSFDEADSDSEWEEHTPLPSSVQVLGTMSSLLRHS